MILNRFYLFNIYIYYIDTFRITPGAILAAQRGQHLKVHCNAAAELPGDYKRRTVVKSMVKGYM